MQKFQPFRLVVNGMQMIFSASGSVNVRVRGLVTRVDVWSIHDGKNVVQRRCKEGTCGASAFESEY